MIYEKQRTWSSPQQRTHPKPLGFTWITPSTTASEPLTKRVIASDTAKVFDVLGLFAPAHVPARTLLQSLWKLPIKWDYPVPEDIIARWTKWTDSFLDINGHPVPRRYTDSTSPIFQASLHGFADASLFVYGAVVYV